MNYGKTIEGEDAMWADDSTLWINGHFIGSVNTKKQKQEIEDRIKKYRVIGNFVFTKKPCYRKNYSGFHLASGYQLKNQYEWEGLNLKSIDLSYPIKEYVGILNLE